jgi:hypothetical protein
MPYGLRVRVPPWADFVVVSRESMGSQRAWFNGRMGPCQGSDVGSIPIARWLPNLARVRPTHDSRASA